MEQQLKEKWVKALRSGEYKQGRDELKSSTDDGFEFCCLGVLCDIVNPELWAFVDDKWEWNGSVDVPKYQPMYLPEFDAELWAYTFDNMNDDEERTFAEIADYIEENL
jgi:hypothetical protein